MNKDDYDWLLIRINNAETVEDLKDVLRELLQRIAISEGGYRP